MGFASELFSLLLITLVIIYIYYRWSFEYWKRKNIPFIEPSFPLGNLRNPAKNGVEIAKDFYGFYKQFKSKNIPYGGIFIGPFPNLFVVDLDLIKKILVKDWQYFMSQGSAVDDRADPYGANLFNMDGENWKEMRPKLTPTFTSGKMKTMFPHVLTSGNLLSEYIHDMCVQDRAVEIKKILGFYIAEVLGSCVFGLQCNNFENPKSDFVRAGQRSFAASPRLALRRVLAFISPRMVAMARLTFFPKGVINFLRKIIDEVLEYRELKNIRRNDLMQVLIDMKVEHKFSHENLSAQAIGFFAAGFETSATTMTFCLYELARKPEIQTRIREEIRTCLEKNDGQLTYDGVMEMKYLDQVINETLRYYPPGGILQRLCTQDYTLPNGEILKKGTMIFLSQLGIQRDEEYFPDPDKFDPERFSDENKTNIRPMTYIPFGEGPRICLGIRFAFMQIKVGLISILKDHEVFPDKSVKYPMEFKPNTIFLTAKDEILIRTRKV